MAEARGGALRPELTVAAVTERDGRFLLVEERVRGRLVINQPAGHVEPGETLLAAVARETCEETAWTFEPEAIVGIYLWPREGNRPAFLRVAFAGRCLAYDPRRELDLGIVRSLWLTRNELLARSHLLRSPMVLRGIDDYLAGTRWPCDLVHDLGMDQLARRAALI